MYQISKIIETADKYGFTAKENESMSKHTIVSYKLVMTNDLHQPQHFFLQPAVWSLQVQILLG